VGGKNRLVDGMVNITTLQWVSIKVKVKSVIWEERLRIRNTTGTKL